MENESKIIELLSDALIRQDQIIEQLKESNQRLVKLELTSGHVEEQLIKLNLLSSENSRAIFKLADKIDQIVDLDNRVSKIEKVVFK